MVNTPPVWTSCRSIGVERYTMFFCGRGQRQNVFSHLKDGPLQKNQCELRCTLYLEYFAQTARPFHTMHVTGRCRFSSSQKKRGEECTEEQLWEKDLLKLHFFTLLCCLIHFQVFYRHFTWWSVGAELFSKCVYLAYLAGIWTSALGVVYASENGVAKRAVWLQGQGDVLKIL